MERGPMLSGRGLWLLIILAVATSLHADDGAASIAAGGIVVMKREPRIVMAKEVLRISPSKIVVDYDFRNDSDEDISTEVAFPIPDYYYNIDKPAAEQGFDDFKLWVDATPVRYEIEARAFGRDDENVEFTQVLTAMRVDIASLGHAMSKDSPVDSRDIKRLTAAQRKELVRLKLIEYPPDGDSIPLWRVRKKYHWQQTFPAHKVVHIRHEYTPNTGSTNNIAYGMGPDPDTGSVEEIKSFCVDSPLKGILQRVLKSDDREASYAWVDFILTTANTWKTPIEDFTLIVERPHWKDWKTKRDMGNYVSFCWDGPVTKVDADHFFAHVQNLVPKEELRIGFFVVESRRGQ
jgi:hypothetical protein